MSSTPPTILDESFTLESSDTSQSTKHILIQKILNVEKEIALLKSQLESHNQPIDQPTRTGNRQKTISKQLSKNYFPELSPNKKHRPHSSLISPNSIQPQYLPENVRMSPWPVFSKSKNNFIMIEQSFPNIKIESSVFDKVDSFNREPRLLFSNNKESLFIPELSFDYSTSGKTTNCNFKFSINFSLTKYIHGPQIEFRYHGIELTVPRCISQNLRKAFLLCKKIGALSTIFRLLGTFDQIYYFRSQLYMSLLKSHSISLGPRGISSDFISKGSFGFLLEIKALSQVELDDLDVSSPSNKDHLLYPEWWYIQSLIIPKIILHSACIFTPNSKISRALDLYTHPFCDTLNCESSDIFPVVIQSSFIKLGKLIGLQRTISMFLDYFC